MYVFVCHILSYSVFYTVLAIAFYSCTFSFKVEYMHECWISLVLHLHTHTCTHKHTPLPFSHISITYPYSSLSLHPSPAPHLSSMFLPLWSHLCVSPLRLIPALDPWSTHRPWSLLGPVRLSSCSETELFFIQCLSFLVFYL